MLCRMHRWRKRSHVRSWVQTKSRACHRRTISTARTSHWCVVSCWHSVRVKCHRRYSHQLPRWWITWTSVAAPQVWDVTLLGCLPPTLSRRLHCRQLSGSASWTARWRRLCSTVCRCCQCRPTSTRIQGPTVAHGIHWSTQVWMLDWTVYRVQTIRRQANTIRLCERTYIWYTCYNCHLSQVRRMCTWIGTVSCLPEQSSQWSRKICFMDAHAIMMSILLKSLSLVPSVNCQMWLCNDSLYIVLTRNLGFICSAKIAVSQFVVFAVRNN